MSTNLISVIIPCYNAEKFIGDAIRSVLGQTHTDFELIVVNDGSTDRSKEVIDQFTDPRIKALHQSNGGVSAARNTGIKEAKGSWVAFLDADDCYLPENLEKKLAFLKANPQIHLVHGFEEIFKHGSGEVLSISSGIEGVVTRDLLEFTETVIHSPSSVMCSKEILLKTGGFNEDLSTSADWELWVRLSRMTEFGLIRMPKTKYRIHPEQMHTNVSKMEADMTKSFRFLKREGYFLSERHYRYCWAKLSLILVGSYVGDARNYRLGAKYLLISILANPIHVLRKLKKSLIK